MVILIAGAGIASLAAIQSFASTLVDTDVVVITQDDQSCKITDFEKLIPKDLFLTAADLEPVDVSGFGGFPEMIFVGSHYDYVVHVEPRCRSPGDSTTELAIYKKVYPEPELQ